MRIHSDHISSLEIKKAATVAGVEFTRFSEHKSRKRAGAFDVVLTGSSTRRQNTNDNPDFAATWDEWGIFLGILFDLDESMVTPYYLHAEDFHWQTNHRFEGGQPPADFVRGHQHKWEFSGRTATGNIWLHECTKCDAVRRYTDNPAAVFDS